MKVVVTIPALNEQETIARVVADIPRQLPGFDSIDVIVIDDGSTDATAARAAAAGATVFTLRGRPGLGYVFRSGMELAIRLGADVIVNIDGDGQFQSREVPRLIAPILAGRADFVTCTRFERATPPAGMPLVKYWGNRSVTSLVNWLAGLELSDVSCGFRAYNREAAYRLSQFGRWTYTEESVIDLASKGLRIAEVPLSVRGEREYGTSRVVRSVVRFGAQLTLILALVVRDKHAMAFFGVLAASFVVVGFCAAAVLLLWAALHREAPPFAAMSHLIAAVLVVTVLIFVLGQLADLVARHRAISEELLYLARRKYGGRTSPPAPPAPPSSHMPSLPTNVPQPTPMELIQSAP